MRLLIYAFKPYGPYPHNISEQVLAAMPDKRGIVKRIFPVRFDYQMFYKTFKEVAPDIVIGLGQHPRARKIRIERKAMNLMKLDDGTIQTIKADAPVARYSNLKLPESPITTVTYDAGTYVCNYSMFAMGEYAELSNVQYGFLHIPRSMGVMTIVGYLTDMIKVFQNSFQTAGLIY
jgi:pyrrolidone-carboxylate peptidase